MITSISAGVFPPPLPDDLSGETSSARLCAAAAAAKPPAPALWPPPDDTSNTFFPPQQHPDPADDAWSRLRASATPTTAGTGRFAPSATGPAHPGTLLAALLAWLDARSRGARFLLRLEDLDPQRCSPGLAAALADDLRWLGIDWDGGEPERQSSRGSAEGHEAALDRLERAGRLYACSCSRQDVRWAALRGGGRAPDGGWAYPNTCRPPPPQGAGEGEAGRTEEAAAAAPFFSWRECRARGVAVRARLPDGLIEGLRDEADDDDDSPFTPPPPLDLSQDPSAAFGDPVVLRRDGSVAYLLASVVDDAVRARATRVVRGRDVAPSTATQEALRRLLGLRGPRAYRHHLLLLEPAAAAAVAAGDSSAAADAEDDDNGSNNKKKKKNNKRKQKLAKLHGSVGAPQLRQAGYTGADVAGFLAWVCGLRDAEGAATPRELLARGFSWARVRREDQVVAWDGARLRWLGGADAAADEQEDEEEEEEREREQQAQRKGEGRR